MPWAAMFDAFGVEAWGPLFTDWPAIRAWTDEPVSTLVMPAREA